MRSINNIVDISNFVMLELGQPTHAFDADKLKGGINVRLAQRLAKNFSRSTARPIRSRREDLVIADQERAVGIGGVMGGEETGVTESTQKRFARSRIFLAGERSPHGAEFESAERRQLSLRARRRSGNDFARVGTRGRIDARNRRRKAGGRNR